MMNPRNAMTRFCFLMALLLPSSAFVVTPVKNNKASTTATYASTIYSDFEGSSPLVIPQDDEIKYTEPVTGRREGQQHLQSMELPRHSPSQGAKALQSLEAIAGRGAMIAALALMVTEVTTGMSLPEQLSKFLS